MSTLASLVVQFTADTSGFITGAKNMESQSKSLTGVLGGLGKAAFALGAGAVVGLAGLGVAAVKAASDFEGGMREVNTMLGLNQEGFAALSAETVDLTKRLGVDAVGATKALYQAISAGVPRENAITFLEVASKAAIGGVTDTETAVDGLTTVINAFKMPITEAERVADLLFTTVKRGKTTFAELSASMSVVAPMAAAAGIALEEVLASVSTLTKQGVPTAQAMTQIRAAIQGLLKPSAEMDTIFQSLGYSNAAAMIKAEGFNVAMAAVRDRTGGDIGALTKLFGSVEAVSAVLGTTGANADMFAGDLASLEGAAGASTAAFEEMNRGVGRQMEILKNRLLGSLIEIGSKILPLILPIITTLADRLPAMLDSMMPAFERLLTGVQVVVSGIGYAVEVLAPIFSSALSTLWAVISSWGQAIYSALSWLNPFASHSPSLVSQVEDGVGEIVDSYGGITAIASPLATAGAAIAQFAGLGKDQIKSLVDATKSQLDDMKAALGFAKDALRGWTDTPLAGSKAYTEKLKAIERQTDELTYKMNLMKIGGAPQEEIDALDKFLKRLGLDAEQVRLEEKLNLGPMRDQLKELANPGKGEQPFAIIRDGIIGTLSDIARLTPAIATMEGLWKGQQGALADVTAAMSTAGGAMSTAGGAAGAMVSPISGLNDIVTSTKDSIAGMTEKVTEMKDGVSQALEPIKTLATYFQVFFDLLARGDIDSALNVVVLGVQRFAGLDISNLVTLGKDALPKIGTAVGDLVTWLKSLWPDPLEKIVIGMKDMATNALLAGRDAIPKITKAVTDGLDALKNWRKTLDENSLVLSIIVGVAAAVATAWAIMTALAVAHSAVMAIQTAITWGLVVAQTALAAPLLLIIAILAGIVAGLIWAYNTSTDFRNFVDTAFAAVQLAAQKTGDVFGVLGTTIGTTWDTLKAVTQTTWANITGSIRSAVNSIIGLINPLITAWNRLEFNIPGFNVELPSVDVPGVGRVGGGWLGWGGVNVSTPDMPLIPTFAAGGVVPGAFGEPQLAIVHGGETVVPAGRGGGNTYHIEVNGIGLDEVATEIERRQRRLELLYA